MKEDSSLAAVLCLVLSRGAASAVTCVPGNGTTYTCDFQWLSASCDLSGTSHATCNAWGSAADNKCVICGKTIAETITGTSGEDVICGVGGRCTD